MSVLALLAAIMPIATISANFPSFEFPEGHRVFGAYMSGAMDAPESQSLLYFNLPLSNPCFTQEEYRQWTQEGTFYTRLVYKIRDGNKPCRKWWEANLPDQNVAFAISLLES